MAKKIGAFEVVVRDIPEPAPGWVRIRVEARGTCHSDVFVRAGGFPAAASHVAAQRGTGLERRLSAGQAVESVQRALATPGANQRGPMERPNPASRVRAECGVRG